VKTHTYPIRPGQLRRRFTIQRRIETQDSYGQPTVQWATFGNVAGGLQSGAGDERFRADQVDAYATHRIVTRYIPGVDAKMRLVDDRDRVFDVKAVFDPDDRRVALVWIVEGEGV